MSSSRLWGKVMLPLAGKPLLERMVHRVRAATVNAKTVVLTSEQSEDNVIAELCKSLDVDCFRGNLSDLLDRHYQAAKSYGADVVAKIPSDCPLIDPQIVERVFARFNAGDSDYVSNLHPATYPDGNDVEIFTFSTLQRAWQEASKDFEREHTTPFIWEHPERFRIGNAEWETGRDYSMTHRWTIDYPEDYELIRCVYDELYSAQRPIFSLNDILNLLCEKPELAELNAKYLGVNWYRKHLKSLRTVSPKQTRILEEEGV
jgi:spore coat polysaccharide biosynthesis protein SpsF